jgi:Winged helix-turn-helix
MYGSYLYYTQLADYLSLLIENELIEYQKSDHTYVTTAKELESPNFSFWWLENQKVANEADPSF